MAEFTEVIDDAFEDVGESVKKLSKNKKFLWIAGGVGVVALIAFYIKSRSGGSESVQYASGYTGYPITTGSSEAYSDDLSSILAEMQTEYDDTISDVQTEYENAMSGMQSDYENAMSEMQTEYESSISILQDENEALSNMLAEKTPTTYIPDYESNVNYMGMIYDAILTGADANTINSLNAKRDQKIEVSGMNLESVNSSYDPTMDYTALISQAREAGASQAVIDNLTAQRNAKIMGEYGGIDPDTKKPITSGSSSSSSSGKTSITAHGSDAVTTTSGGVTTTTSRAGDYIKTTVTKNGKSTTTFKKA